MKKFIVRASYSTRGRVEVFASDADEALQIAKGFSGDMFEREGADGWQIYSAVEVEHQFTRDQLAFIEAYGIACAAEKADTVKAFFMLADDDEFCDRYGTGAYSSIMDAFQIWQLAISHQRAIEKTN